MTLGEAKTKALQLINRYSKKGTVLSQSENIDYLNRMNSLFDLAQKELATIRKIPAVYSITQSPIPNMLGLLQGFDLEKHLSTDITTTQGVGAKAYYFEVSGNATVYIEEYVNDEWVVLETININTTSFTAYKGHITASDPNNTIRIRFSGDYPYTIRNRALYAYSFPTDSDIPDYRPYVKYQMPSDFMELKEVVREYDQRQRRVATNFYWEGKRTFVVNYYDEGSYDIHYYRYPTTIDLDTEDTYEFEIDIDAQEIMPFFVAGNILMDKDVSIGTMLLNQYEAKKDMLDGTQDQGYATVENVLGW